VDGCQGQGTLGRKFLGKPRLILGCSADYDDDELMTLYFIQVYQLFCMTNLFDKLHTLGSVVLLTVCLLGGVMVSVFVIGPEVSGFKPSRGDRFLRALKIGSTHSFGGEGPMSSFYGVLNVISKLSES
jgi:hypothetical protein